MDSSYSVENCATDYTERLYFKKSEGEIRTLCLCLPAPGVCLLPPRTVEHASVEGPSYAVVNPWRCLLIVHRMNRYDAFILDLNGTMINDMHPGTDHARKMNEKST